MDAADYALVDEWGRLKTREDGSDFEDGIQDAHPRLAIEDFKARIAGGAAVATYRACGMSEIGQFTTVLL